MTRSHSPVWDLNGLTFSDEPAPDPDRAPLAPGTFPQALARHEQLLARRDRALAVAGLHMAVRASDPAAETLRQRAAAVSRNLGPAIRRFEQAFAALDAHAASACLSALGDHPAVHALAKARAMARYRLDPAQETLLDDLAGEQRHILAAQWNDLAGRVQAGREAALAGHPDPARRKRAATRLSRALSRHRSLFARTLAAVIGLEARETAARALPHWLFPRCLAEETTPQAVAGLVARLEESFPLVGRYYRLKARLLGHDILPDRDRLAPLPGTLRRQAFPTMADQVLAAITDLSPSLAEAARRIFQSGHIDAAPRPGKTGGAFCQSLSPGEVPYILLNSRGSPRDAAVLAHELGHGVHHLLADPLGLLAAEPCAALAEAVAVLFELALFQTRLSRAATDADRLAVLCQRLEDDITTIFRQAALHGFEDALRHRETLSADDLDALWTQTLSTLHQDAITAPCPTAWAATPHFCIVPGYVHVYARAGCLAWAIWSRCHDMGDAFAPALVRLCAAGNSRPLAELLAPFGIDPDAPGLERWAVERFAGYLAEAERLAGAGAGTGALAGNASGGQGSALDPPGGVTPPGPPDRLGRAGMT